MGHVISSGSMSLDGYIAYADHTVGSLFDWYDAGEEEVTSASPDVTFHLTPTSAAYWRDWAARVGALVVGRELFDLTDGWGGRHPLGVPVVVATHEPPDDWRADGFSFVTTGVEDAVAQAREVAGAKDVGVAAGTIASQALRAGLLDYVAVDLVPVVLGSGRPYFTGSEDTSRLGDPVSVVESTRVTHLVFPVEG